MSFGFAIGDFIAVGQLAWTLYRECYQIARGAPQEFSLLVSELSTLSNSITILQEEAKDPKSTLTRSGNDRIRMVNEMVAGIEETLKRLKKAASKYDILGSGSKTKQIWARFKWSAELSSIDRLRNKLIYHNTVINLLLTSVGNSSLQRIESSNTAMASDVQAIKDCIASHQTVVASKVPALSAVDDDLINTSLSARLMTNAEVHQPWSTIGFNQWIGTGRWWLLRAQMELRTITESERSVAPAAYAGLIKASWILVDVIPSHPQFPFISASTRSQVRSLSAEVTNEFSRITALAMVVPALDELRNQDLRLWESIPAKAPLLRPYKASQNTDEWSVDGGEHVLFRRFAVRKSELFTTSPCILLFLVHESVKAARLIAQDQFGDIVKVISFQEHVDWGRHGESVMAGNEEFVLDNSQEAQVLCTMIETSNFYVLARQANHASLKDLRAYMLLTTIKNQQERAMVQIRQESSAPGNIGSLAQFVESMASRWIEGSLFQEDNSDQAYRRCWNCHTSLFTWAVTCTYTTLTEFLLGEKPAVNVDTLTAAATHGNESVVRWFLVSPSANDRDVLQSLYIAMKHGHENLIALLVDAGADLTDRPPRSLRTFTHQVLTSDLSEPVVHAFLAFTYASKDESECDLREAVDRGHEGATVLLSYAETIKRRKKQDNSVYSSYLTHNSGTFRQFVAALAMVPNFLPAFDLTLRTVEKRRTKVLLKVVRLAGCTPRAVIYLDSYHAYIEDAPKGLPVTYKKAIKIGPSGEYCFTVVHQEESLKLTFVRQKLRSLFYIGLGSWINVEVGGRCIENFRLDRAEAEEKSVELPIS